MAEFTKQIRDVNDYEKFKSLVEQKYNSKVTGYHQEQGIGVLELANGDEVKYWDDKKLIGNPFGRRGKDNRIPAHFTKTKYSEFGYKKTGSDDFATNYALKFGAGTLAYAKSLGLTQAQIRRAEASGVGNAADERLALREFAFPKPVNPITLRKDPVQAVRGTGTWQVEVVGDIHDLSEARLKSYQSLAGSSMQPTTHLQGDLVELIFTFDTKTAAEGAMSRLQGHPDFSAIRIKEALTKIVGETETSLQSIHDSRSPRSKESDERQSNADTIEPDDPRVEQWVKDQGRVDVSGIDTPRKHKGKKAIRRARKSTRTETQVRGIRK